MDDLAALPAEKREPLIRSVGNVEVDKLPVLKPYAKRPGDNGKKL